MIFESARLVLSENEMDIQQLRTNLDTADQYQQQVFDRQLLEESKYKSFVSDRSLIDVLAYSGAHSRILQKLLKSQELADYIQELRNQFVFLIHPTPATLASDGVREAINWEQIISIHSQIKLFYDIFDIRYFLINIDSMKDRCQFVDAVLSLSKVKINDQNN